MKKVLESLEKMKQDWAHEKMRLEGEREYLQGAADRINREIDQAKKDYEEKEEALSVCDFLIPLAALLIIDLGA